MSANYRPGQLEGILETARRRGLIVSDTVKGANLPVQPPPVATLAPSGGQDSGKKKAKRRRRRIPNKTEQAFGRLLESKRIRGEITRYEFEGIALRWGGTETDPPMLFSPDWIAFLPDGRMICYEVKGAHVFASAVPRFKGARAQWPEIEWEMWQYARGEWTRIH